MYQKRKGWGVVGLFTCIITTVHLANWHHVIRRNDENREALQLHRTHCEVSFQPLKGAGKSYTLKYLVIFVQADISSVQS